MIDKALHIRVFSVLWAIAHIGHVLRKEFTFQPIVWILLLACVLLIERPASRVRLGFLALAQICLFVIRLPATDNHMYIMFFINAGILVVVAAMLWREEPWSDRYRASVTSYTVIVLVAAYLAAAVAKLNGIFFDPEYSCAVSMLYDATIFIGIGPGDLPASIDAMMPWLVAGTELAIPLLLLTKKTRTAGILLLVLFHIGISISPTATAADFTIMLFAVAYLLLPESASIELKAMYERAHARLPGVLRGDTLSMPVLLLFFLLVTLVWRVGTVAGNRSWALLAPVALVIGGLLCFLAFREEAHRRGPSIRPATLMPVHFVLMALLLFNAATPYLGIKTAGTFTMYSNLNTYAGQSNHFILPRLPGPTLHDDLVEVVRSSNENLDLLRERGLRTTWHELRRQLSRDPGASISFVRAGEFHEYERADQNPELIELHPVLHKLIWHRPDDRLNPRCLW